MMTILTAALLQTAVVITPTEMTDVERVGAVCRAASEASRISGDVADWLRVVRTAGLKGGLNADDQASLLRMCGVYAVASRDAARSRLSEIQSRLRGEE